MFPRTKRLLEMVYDEITCFCCYVIFELCMQPCRMFIMFILSECTKTRLQTSERQIFFCKNVFTNRTFKCKIKASKTVYP